MLLKTGLFTPVRLVLLREEGGGTEMIGVHAGDVDMIDIGSLVKHHWDSDLSTFSYDFKTISLK